MAGTQLRFMTLKMNLFTSSSPKCKWQIYFMNIWAQIDMVDFNYEKVRLLYKSKFSSVRFSHSVVSDSLQPHELQHARPPCPSPTPGVHWDSRPSSQWCHPAISSCVVPFSSWPQSLPASVFSNESTLRMRWPKYWSFSFSIIPSNEIPGLPAVMPLLLQVARGAPEGRKDPRTSKWPSQSCTNQRIHWGSGAKPSCRKCHPCKILLSKDRPIKLCTSLFPFSSVQSLSCVRLCDPVNQSTPGLPVHHQLPESTQIHVHYFGDAIQPSHPLSSPSPPALNLSQHQGLFKWVSSSHQAAKVLECQLQHQSFQWTPRTELL